MSKKEQEYYKKWAKAHKEERRLYRQEWYQKNKHRIDAMFKARYIIEPEFRKKRYAYVKNYIEKNKEYWNERQRKYQRRRYATDPAYREKQKARGKAWYRKNRVA